MKRQGGKRRKSRQAFTKSFRNKGKVSITSYLQTFEEGDKVKLGLEPSIQKGVYHPRFKGRTGVVMEQQGECYVVQIKDGGKEKKLTVHPVHLVAL